MGALNLADAPIVRAIPAAVDKLAGDLAVRPKGALTEITSWLGDSCEAVRRFEPVTFAFGKPFLQDVVHFCHAVLDEPIEASELLIGVSHLALQSGRQLDEAGPVAERFLASRYAPIVPHLFWGTSRGS